MDEISLSEDFLVEIDNEIDKAIQPNSISNTVEFQNGYLNLYTTDSNQKAKKFIFKNNNYTRKESTDEKYFIDKIESLHHRNSIMNGLFILGMILMGALLVSAIVIITKLT